jgi:hypothetical protein
MPRRVDGKKVHPVDDENHHEGGESENVEFRVGDSSV